MNFETIRYSEIHSILEGDIPVRKSVYPNEVRIGVIKKNYVYELALASNEFKDFIQAMDVVTRYSPTLVVDSNRVLGSIPKTTLLYKKIEFIYTKGVTPKRMGEIVDLLFGYIDGTKLINSILL